jgi:hypothetical protein
VLSRVRQSLRDDVVRRYLDWIRRSSFGSDLEANRDRRTARERLQRGAEPALGEDPRVDPTGDLTEPVEHVRQPFGNVRQLGPVLAQLGRCSRLRGAYLERQRNELLLGAVVKVPLDLPPRGVSGGDNPCARGLELGAALGVRDCRGHDLGELAQASLGICG